jgi:hypothetical protein
MHDRQIGSQCRILRAKKDKLHPIRRSDDRHEVHFAETRILSLAA